MSVVAVIQARTGSTRFPGKVLADLTGRPVLAHIIDRVSRGASVDRVVVATTDRASDDAVAVLAVQCGAAVVRGPEDDVLTRYVLAAREHAAGIVVRVTADCPMVDWRLLDRVVGALQRTGAEYAGNVDPPTYPDGYDVEALTTACLLRLDAETAFGYEREHVTIRAREHPELYRTTTVRCRRSLAHVRLTVDMPSDLDAVRDILLRLPVTPPPRLGAVIGLLDRIPSLAERAGVPGRDERYLAQRAAARVLENPS